MLSKRLETIANLVDKNKTVIDVGTDHALLPCFLMQNKLCKKVYASDNKKGPLSKAKENIEKYGVNVETILMDGLEKCPKDVNEVIISGMGYYTVEHILDNASKKDMKYIVQINKNPNKLREYISNHNYKILDEKVIKDDFYYEIIVFNTNKHKPYSPLEIMYGPINLRKKDKVFLEYIKYQIDLFKSYKTNKYQDKIVELESIINK